MIYGLYLSASGILANSYREDVISNNLANSETIGFKRDLALFRQRLTAAQESQRPRDWSDPLLERIGGGLYANPTVVDSHAGELVHTANPLDLAVEGDGFFAVKTGDTLRLTRNGQFMVDQTGNLVLNGSRGSKVLDAKGNPIQLQLGAKISINEQGDVTQNGQKTGQIGLYDVADRSTLKKEGGTLLSIPDSAQMRPATGRVRSSFVEQANVDPTTELAELMDAQRQLEANANMIKTQDEMLQQLVQNVGKIS